MYKLLTYYLKNIYFLSWLQKISVHFIYADFSDEQKLQISRFFLKKKESKITYYYI